MPPRPQDKFGGDMPRKVVVHGLFPLRIGGCADHLLFTKQSDDPEFQPIGGKVEGSESLEGALLREIAEETEFLGPRNRLHPSDIDRLVPVTPATPGHPGGIPYVGISPTSGLQTEYLFHPYVVFLTDTGRHRVADALARGHSMFQAVSLDEWCSGQDTFDPAYALAVRAKLESQDLEAAAVDVLPV